MVSRGSWIRGGCIGTGYAHTPLSPLNKLRRAVVYALAPAAPVKVSTVQSV